MFSSSYFLSHTGDRHALHSFPTRRSSDLVVAHRADTFRSRQQKRFLVRGIVTHAYFIDDQRMPHAIDRKSTRLNSSHRCISYAVFCLKKKSEHAEQNASEA